MVHLAWRKGTFDWTTRVCTINYTSCTWLCWKFSGIPLCLFVVRMAISASPMALFWYDSQCQQINLGKVYRAFISDSFLLPKNNKKADRLCMKFSWTSNAIVWKCPNPLNKNQYSPLLLLPVFQSFSQPPGSTKWSTNIFWVTSKSFRFNIRDKSSHIRWNSLGFYLSSEYLLNFLSFI